MICNKELYKKEEHSGFSCGVVAMKNVEIDKGGFRYKWTVRGVNVDACINDIIDNSRTELSDYTAAVFAEEFGCVAEVERVKVMSHNQYQAFLQHNANRLYEDVSYTLEDYRRDADGVEVLPFCLEQFRLDASVQEFINQRFTSISYTASGDACLRCHLNSSIGVKLMADELGCESVCNQGFNGFYKKDKNRLILEFCEGDISLLICSSQKSYAAHLAEFNRFYEIEDYDICLEVYFDNVHMDNIFLTRENVGIAISSMLQRGYDGYDESVKARWEEFLRQKKSPNLSFRAVEAPTMVRDIDFYAAKPKEKETSEKSVSQLLDDASVRSENSKHDNSGFRDREITMD